MLYAIAMGQIIRQQYMYRDHSMTVWCTQAAFGVTVANGSILYISDWQNGTISLYDALSDSLEIIVSEGVGHPAALFYSALTVLSNNGTL